MGLIYPLLQWIASPSSPSSLSADYFEDYGIFSALSPLENSLLPAGAGWVPVHVVVSLEHFLVPHDWETFDVMNCPGLENSFTVQSSRLCSNFRPIQISTCGANDQRVTYRILARNLTDSDLVLDTSMLVAGIYPSSPSIGRLNMNKVTTRFLAKLHAISDRIEQFFVWRSYQNLTKFWSVES